jgi:hypothetical protein
MKRMLLIFSVISVLIMGITASVALAYTKGQAEATADNYAQLHYLAATNGSCTASGKNEAHHAQWYCSGKYNFGANEWKINVDPYGEITYHNP